MVELDQEIDKAGFLRLTTSEQHTQNLGNRFVSEDLVLFTGGQWRTRSAVKAANGLRKRLLELPPVRFILLGLYSRLFHWVHPE